MSWKGGLVGVGLAVGVVVVGFAGGAAMIGNALIVVAILFIAALLWS